MYSPTSSDARVILCAMVVGLSFTAQAEPQVGAASVWQLCTNLQAESPASASLRDESSQELQRRGADCAFLGKGNKAVKTPSRPSTRRDSMVPFDEQNKDLMNRTAPRF